MPALLEHREKIAAAISLLNRALRNAHSEGVAVYLHATSTEHCAIEAIGQPTSYMREPAQVILMDVAEFVEEE